MEGKRKVSREIDQYNLDVVISIGYRVNTKRGIEFRQWATKRLKDYLVQGYAINEMRLAEKQLQLEHLKTAFRILSRAVQQQVSQQDSDVLFVFEQGLQCSKICTLN
jgi:hypothetical protein